MWSMVGTVEIQAETIEDAILEAEDAPLPTDGSYLEDSFKIDHDLIDTQ